IENIPFTLWSGIIIDPQHLLISVSGNSIVLNWDVNADATFYHIYRSTNPYGTYTEIGTPTTNSFTDTDVLLTGEKYFYYFTADNSK
ncbi:MAG: hypothetical protein GQ534_01275, partial [Candidatus Delongbacteria bacterium]|nr:hypothetical protein [Candidatus Delongbacteria bacterium]